MSATTFDSRKGQNIDIITNLHEIFTLVFSVTDQDGVARDLSGESLVFSIREEENGDAIETLTTAVGEITISGDDNDIVAFSKVLDITTDNYFHDLLITTADDESLMDGKLLANYTGRCE